MDDEELGAEAGDYRERRVCVDRRTGLKNLKLRLRGEDDNSLSGNRIDSMSVVQKERLPI